MKLLHHLEKGTVLRHFVLSSPDQQTNTRLSEAFVSENFENILVSLQKVQSVQTSGIKGQTFLPFGTSGSYLSRVQPQSIVSMKTSTLTPLMSFSVRLSLFSLSLH